MDAETPGHADNLTFSRDTPDSVRSLAKSVVIALTFWAILAATWEVARLSATKPVPLKRNERVRLDDLGELQKYRESNLKLKPDADRIVFYGDSITYFWNLASSFPGANYVNRGIGGQTSADMVVRFRQDVIGLQPNSVVILAGVNDFFWRNEGSDNDDQTLANLEANDQTMAELAELHQIRPVFVSLLPLHDYTPAAQVVYAKVPSGMIVAANHWLRAFCTQHGYQYIDDYSAMVDQQGMLRRDLSEDGIHPNSAGYRVMAQVFSTQFHENQGAVRH